MKKNKILAAPFLRTKTTTSVLMMDVLIALIPVCVMAVMKFGIRSLWMIIFAVVTAVLLEYLFQKLTRQPITVTDGSACVTGLLVGLSYPVTVPFWILLLGNAIAIIGIKQMAGGLGKNHLNPAVFSRVIIKILFTPIITNWVTPLPDLVSSATPLAFIGNGAKVIREGSPSLQDAFFGSIGGGIGETVKWAILLGALYLVIRQVIDFRVPLATLFGLFMGSLLFGESSVDFALMHVLSGTAMFAAVFMVTDYSSGPMNKTAKIYYALSIGVLTAVIRQVFDLPGGIGIAIIIMNLTAPMFDTRFLPRVFGQTGISSFFEPSDRQP